MGFDVGSIKSSEILDLCLFQYMLHDIYIYIYGGGSFVWFGFYIRVCTSMMVSLVLNWNVRPL